MPDELSLAIVGARFENPKRKGTPRGDRQMEILLSEPGEAVTLVHEPKNPADGNAIAVLSARGIQIGYIVADRTSIIHRAWHDGREARAIFQGLITGGAAIRVAFDREPTLPPPRPDHLPDAKKMVGSPDAWDGIDDIPPDE